MGTTMEASRPSSPTPDQVQKTPDAESECRRSPTTVLDTVDLVDYTKTLPSNGDVPHGENDDALTVAGFANTNYDYFTEQQQQPSEELSKEDLLSKLRKKQRERRKFLSILPTIKEVSEEEEREGEVKKLGLTLLSENDDISLHIQTLSAPITTNTVNESEEVQRLIDAASQRAAKGNEEKALAIYKDGLSTVKKEVIRITKQLEALAMRGPKIQKTALYIILHEEWAESALVLADIRTRMATIYERREDYKKALFCCEEARAIYRRQAAFDEQHRKKGSSARDKIMSVENMMEQIEEAMESQQVRQSLHQTVERIREKIVATTDETSRGFLYEDIFDKLSTVLSLELMYLGETHPQIANTKGLLSKFYSEIGQNEKALRAMNDAVLLCEMTLGDLHPQTGSKYQDAATLYESIGGEENCSKAIYLYEKAITTLERAEGNVSERLCSSLNRLAVLYMERQSFDIAIKKLRIAIHISEENYRERSDDISTEPIQLWLNLGECQALKGEPALATEASLNALRIQKDKRKVHNSLRKGPRTIPDLISNSKIAFTMIRLGKSLAEELKFEESYSWFTEALSILQGDLSTAQESVKFNPTIDLPQHEEEVASALYNLAKVKQADTKYDEAKEIYKESLEMFKESDKKRTVGERSNQMDSAMCLAGIGSIELIQDEDSEAFKSFNQAICYAKQKGLDDSHPIVLMLWEKSRFAANRMNKLRNQNAGTDSEKVAHDDFVISRLEEKTKESMEARDFENSIKTINTVIGMKRNLLEKIKGEEQSTKAKRQLAVSLITKGEIALMKNERKDATDCINEASGLLKESGLDQNDQRFQQIEKIHDKIRKSEKKKTTDYTDEASLLKKESSFNRKTEKTNRLKKIGDRIRKINRRSESTMAEF